MTTYNATEFKQLVRTVLKAISGSDAIVVGGLAVRFHGLDRVTTDIDLLSADIAEVCSRVIPLGFYGNGEILHKGRFEFVRMFHKISGTPVDVIVRNKLFSNINSRPAIIHSVKTSVVDLDGLIRMKLLSGREKDKNDLLFLKGGRK